MSIMYTSLLTSLLALGLVEALGPPPDQPSNERVSCAERSPSNGTPPEPFTRNAAVQTIQYFCHQDLLIVPNGEIEKYADHHDPSLQGPLTGAYYTGVDNVMAYANFFDCSVKPQLPFVISRMDCERKLLRVLDECDTNTVDAKYGGFLREQVSL